jgi:predicted transcriptional regulator
MAISKSEFAKRLGVSRPTISRYCAMGMTGHLEDGQIDEDVARQWVKETIRPHVSDGTSAPPAVSPMMPLKP